MIRFISELTASNELSVKRVLIGVTGIFLFAFVFCFFTVAYNAEPYWMYSFFAIASVVGFLGSIILTVFGVATSYED